ncbi:MAG: SPOR domain-containing protein, partial [Bacteroidales bacterium]|nr:SPOR domain-containing protein [Bacteroidales bacterium]
MRSIHIMLALLALMTFTGCDFMRKVAGRPTSEDIENRRIEILKAEEAALMARLDSLREAEQKMLRDSLEALDSIRQLGGSILNPAAMGGLFATKLEARYYIILGSFRTRSYAENLFNVAKDAGYRPALISFGNGGLIAVGVSPVNRLQDALAALHEVKNKPIIQRLNDKCHRWDSENDGLTLGLSSLLPSIMTQGLVGYYY